MLSASAFGSADNTYLDLDYSVYHKNLIQQLFKIARVIRYPRKDSQSSFFIWQQGETAKIFF